MKAWPSFWKKKLRARILEVSDSWIFTIVITNDFEVIIACTYLRSSRNIVTTLELLQLTLDDIINTHGHLPILILGDFNARLGNFHTFPAELSLETSLTYERSALGTVTYSRGRKLADSMRKNYFIVLNGRTSSDSPAQFTCTDIRCTIFDLDGSTQPTSPWSTMKVIQEVNPSDHFPLSISLFSTTVTLFKPPSFPINQVTYTWSNENEESFKANLRHSDKSTANFMDETVDQLSSKLL